VNKKLFGDYFGGCFRVVLFSSSPEGAQRAYVRIDDKARFENRLGASE